MIRQRLVQVRTTPKAYKTATKFHNRAPLHQSPIPNPNFLSPLIYTPSLHSQISSSHITLVLKSHSYCIFSIILFTYLRLLQLVYFSKPQIQFFRFFMKFDYQLNLCICLPSSDPKRQTYQLIAQKTLKNCNGSNGSTEIQIKNPFFRQICFFFFMRKVYGK